ncbi:hypothetical protein HDU93_008723 [Gonapodya sp. JEL0774]|nr:hypothetical protein HDU93_008723 [Gonapodya sp. JEL0774]
MSNQNSGLAFGLNITKKKPIIGPAKPGFLDGGRQPRASLILPQKRKAPTASLLGEPDDDAIAGQSGRVLSDKDRARAEIRAAQKKSEELTRLELQKTLESEDASIFDYDGAYDDIKAAEREAKRQKGALEEDKEKGRKQPRYIGNLLRAAEQRKIDLLQATERKIQREREAEGDEFGDTEKFVTGAYKQTIEDMRRTEEEETKRAEMEDVTRKGDLTGFFRTMLNETTRKVVVPQKGAASGTSAIPTEKVTHSSVSADPERAESQQVRHPLPSGVIVNDSDEIVDKRQLLSGGLNITSSKTKTAAQLDREDREEKERVEREQRIRDNRAKEEERRRRMAEAERTAAYVEEQRRAVEEQLREKKAKEIQELKEVTQRRTNETAAEEARRRFLERKKAGAAAAALEDSDED